MRFVNKICQASIALCLILLQASQVQAAAGSDPNSGIPDLSIKLSIMDVTVTESIGGFRLPITLSQPTAFPVEIVVATRRGSAVNPEDFFGNGLSITIPAGETQASFFVRIVDDTLEESTESFTVRILKAEGVQIDRGVAVITIEDDDQGALSQFQLEIGPAVAEGDGEVTVTVSLIPPTTSATSVLIATRPGSGHPAIPGQDYYGIFQKLDFAAGESQKDVSIVILNDTVTEPIAEFFDVRLFRPSPNAGLIPFRDITVIAVIDDDAR